MSYFTVFYRDGDKRIAVMTVLREGLGSPAAPPTAPPHALAISSGYGFSWRPQSGVEVNVATVGLTQVETEALVSRLGLDPARGPVAYGLISLPPGFRVVGDEDDTTITGATLSVYAAPDANIVDSPSRQPRADVTIGHASETYREIDRVLFDERASVTIRGRAVDVVPHRANADHGSIVTVSWFERPGLLVDITAYNMTTGRSSRCPPSRQWNDLHHSSPRWASTKSSRSIERPCCASPGSYSGRTDQPKMTCTTRFSRSICASTASTTHMSICGVA